MTASENYNSYTVCGEFLSVYWESQVYSNPLLWFYWFSCVCARSNKPNSDYRGYTKRGVEALSEEAVGATFSRLSIYGFWNH